VNRAAQTPAHGARRTTDDGEQFWTIGRVTERNTSRRRSPHADEQSRHHPGHPPAIPGRFYGGGPFSYRGHSTSGCGGVFLRYGLAREDSSGGGTGHGGVPLSPGVSVRRVEKIFRVPAMAATFTPATAKGKDAPTCGTRSPVHGTREILSHRPSGIPWKVVSARRDLRQELRREERTTSDKAGPRSR
jgi:hypothetical protein